MPSNEYRCRTCGHVFHQLTFKGDDPPAGCPRCSAKTVELITAAEGFMAAAGLGSLFVRIPKGPS